MATPSESASTATPPTRRLALLEARLNPAPPLNEEDEVRSFSSEGSLQRPPVNPRRKYAPRVRPRDPAPAITKKRKRGSPGLRTARVDSFFKPVPPSAKEKETNPRDPNEEAEMPRSSRRALEFTDSPAPAPASNAPVETNEDGYRYFRECVDRLTAENEALRGNQNDMNDLRAENEDLRTQLELEIPDLRQQLAAKTEEVLQITSRADGLTSVVTNVIVQLAKNERQEARKRVAAESERLGKVVVERSRTSLHEVWEHGSEWKRVGEELKAIQKEREELEKKRKEATKKKGLAQKNQLSNGEDELSEAGKRGEMPPPRRPIHMPYEETSEYALEQEDIYKVRLQLLKREEVNLQEELARLERERAIMVREIRRQSDERLSSFSNFPVLNERYQLLNLLGRGGFSEVFKGFDLKRAKYVACKIHQLASNWSEEKKRSFIRHAWREYKIHKSLNHPRVVQLVDIFEINETTFCTVLEYCDGCDLDSYLRKYRTLAEKEARSIIQQVFSGLHYLAQQKRRIIHYDLKPGNILLHKGEVQITDFGLSKVMNESESTTEGMELTSQGAGTMWYLPPECFETANQARISAKVDVWSAGVILFQMLYGRKPFGHDQTQEKMFREKTVSHQELEFPSRPAVSDVAKDFMRQCLTRSATSRLDVRQALMHPFLKKR